jgi:hypothetical protein
MRKEDGPSPKQGVYSLTNETATMREVMRILNGPDTDADKVEMLVDLDGSVKSAIGRSRSCTSPRTRLLDGPEIP